ncbi:helix-turn-helix transcriptional regulator [Oscillatoria acuminata]|uniref:Putative transcriptional regulator n=1 Tax=Oscillatoria acuminata PCC 6304 TaxID=56110 RepID=K9TSE9_9CYAN|nr:WYL domain-containing protein [Oscillatoria acuminata]AFY85313.1 putative transcriptional regulator [Oscillatoria acuminata PCC 6304]
MIRKKETITLSIPPGTKERLEEIAAELKVLWGDRGSISGLLTAIAQGKFQVGQSLTLTSAQVQALQQANRLLIDTGHSPQAQTLTSLLLDRGNLEAPLRLALQQLVNQPSEVWRLRAEEQIQKQQPFRLFYLNAQERELEYTVRCAQVTFREKRFYLEIWCEETEDIPNTDFPELIHNRCLRLDRIQEIQPIAGEWRNGLDFIEVYLHFYEGLVKAYESKDSDISNEVIGEVRQVVRRVSHPFWLIREILPYGKKCLVVAPQAMRDRVKEEIHAIYQRYLEPDTLPPS